MRVKVVRDCCPCQNEHARLTYARERAVQRTTNASDQIKQEYQRACRYRRCSQKYRAAYMKTNGNANADASANNNTNTRINTNITERARRTPKIRIASRTRWASPSHHIRRPRRTHAKPTDCYQVFGIFGPSFWDFWLRNWTKNLVQKLHQKRGQATGIDAKTLRGNQFKMRLQKIGLLWRAYTKSTWTKFLVQFLGQILGPGSGPRFWTSSGPSFWSNS